MRPHTTWGRPPKPLSTPTQETLPVVVTPTSVMAPTWPAVVEAWPDLPEALKAGIVAMVKAAAK